MTNNNETTNTTVTQTVLPPWKQEGWQGPTVETRPENAGAEWPEGAVERVTFTREALPTYAFPDRLPYTEYFGEDGWPLHTPERAKPRLDRRVQAMLRLRPCVCYPEQWHEATWIREFSDYDRYLRWHYQARRIHDAMSARILPEPRVHA